MSNERFSIWAAKLRVATNMLDNSNMDVFSWFLKFHSPSAIRESLRIQPSNEDRSRNKEGGSSAFLECNRWTNKYGRSCRAHSRKSSWDTGFVEWARFFMP